MREGWSASAALQVHAGRPVSAGLAAADLAAERCRRLCSRAGAGQDLRSWRVHQGKCCGLTSLASPGTHTFICVSYIRPRTALFCARGRSHAVRRRHIAQEWGGATQKMRAFSVSDMVALC